VENQQMHQLLIQFSNYEWELLHVPALQGHLQEAFPEDGKVMPKHVGATMHN
jgi:hypothetical protein